MHPRLSPSIHGHEVLAAITASGQLFTRDSLTAFIVERFGADARFHTCSASEMTAGDLVEFLSRRGKFTGDETGFTTDPTRVCQH